MNLKCELISDIERRTGERLYLNPTMSYLLDESVRTSARLHETIENVFENSDPDKVLAYLFDSWVSLVEYSLKSIPIGGSEPLVPACLNALYHPHLRRQAEEQVEALKLQCQYPALKPPIRF